MALRRAFSHCCFTRASSVPVPGIQPSCKSIAKVIFLCYPASPWAEGRSHPTVTPGVQHQLLCLAFPRMQTRFACLCFGDVLKTFSPGQPRLWRRNTSPTKLSLVTTPSPFALQPGWGWATSAHQCQRRVPHNVPIPNNWLEQGIYPFICGIPTTVVLIPSSPISSSQQTFSLSPSKLSSGC